MRRLVSSILAMSILGLASAALADEDEEEEVPLLDRFYLTFGAGQSFESFDEPSGVSYDDAPGGGLRIGFEATSFIDTELQYEYSGQFEDRDINRRANLHTVTANVKIRPVMAFKPDFLIQPYVLLGGGWMGSDVSGPGADDFTNGAVFRGGAGIEVPIDVFISAYTEFSYVVAGGNNDEYDYAHVGAGFVVRFDTDGW